MGADDIGTPQTLSSVALATAGTTLLGAVAHLTDVSPVWAAAAGVPAAASFVKAKIAGLSTTTALYRFGCYTCAGAWLWNAADTTPWSVGSFTALGVGAGTAGLLAPVAAWRNRKVAEKRTRLAWLRYNARLRAEWRIRMQKVCGLRGHVIQDVKQWSNGYGYDVFVNMVETGKEWQTIKPAQGRLATAANLPLGCGVQVRPGATRGGMVLRVNTKDAMAAIHPFPTADLSVTSIDEPLDLGVKPSGEIAAALCRWQRWIVAGPPESGKSNLLKTVIGGVLRTDNAAVRIIDLNGGGLAWAFLYAYRDGKTDVPAIDWVAADDDEAALLAEDTLWEAQRRKRAYPHLLIDDDKLPAGTGRDGDAPPAIILIVDEGAEVGGAADTPAAVRARKAIAEIIRIGRAGGVNVINCVLRGTIDMSGATANKRLSGTRILMRSRDAQVEGGHLFGADPRYRVDGQEAAYPGCSWLSEDGNIPEVYRAFRTVGRTIDDIVIATSDRRPEVFPSPHYARRWERTAIPGSDVDVPQRGMREPATTGGGGSRLDQMRAIRDRVRSIAERAREQRGDIRHDPGLAGKFEDVIKGFELPDAPAPAQRLDIGARMIQVVRESGTAGVSGDRVLEALMREGYKVPSRATIYRWLGDAEELVLTDRGFVHRDNLTG